MSIYEKKYIKYKEKYLKEKKMVEMNGGLSVLRSLVSRTIEPGKLNKLNEAKKYYDKNQNALTTFQTKKESLEENTYNEQLKNLENACDDALLYYNIATVVDELNNKINKKKEEVNNELKQKISKETDIKQELNEIERAIDI